MFWNLKTFANTLEEQINLALSLAQSDRIGALKLIQKEIEYSGLNGDHSKISEKVSMLINAAQRDGNAIEDIRATVVSLLKEKHEHSNTDFSGTSFEKLVDLLIGDFNSLHHFGEIRKKVLEATQRVIQKMAQVTTARELINYVIHEIQNIASSNRMLLYEEVTLQTGVPALDATLAWGTAKFKIAAPVANVLQKLKVIVARKLGLLPYVLPKPGEEHLSAATKVWVDKSEPILIVNIPPINLIEIFSFPENWDAKDFSQLQVAKLSAGETEHIHKALGGFSKVEQKDFRDIKDKLRLKIIYGLKEQPYEILDFSGRPINLIQDGVLVKRENRYVFLKLEFDGDFDVYGVNPKVHRWEFRGKNAIKLNPPITKVANVKTMVLFPMSNLGVLYISDIDLQFTNEGKISNEGKLYLESIRVLTEILNQAIAPIKQKEELERFRKTSYRSNVAKFGKDVADQLFELSQKGDITVAPKEEKSVLRFTDMRASTTYSEFLKNPAHAFLLINAFHDAFNEHTLDHTGRIISHGGDGGLHAFYSSRDAFWATVCSQKELMHRSRLLNFQLFDSYVRASFQALEGSQDFNENNSKAKNKIKLYKYQFVNHLLLSIADTYRISMKTHTLLNQFRRRIYEKLKKSKNQLDILKDATEFFPDVIEYSTALYEMSNGELKKKIQPLFAFDLRFSAALHEGNVAVGSIGSLSGSIDVTMIGDPVNLTSRLEHLNRQYGTTLIVSEEYLNSLLGSPLQLTGQFKYKGEKFGYRELDSVRVVGKEKPTTIYEILI